VVAEEEEEGGVCARCLWKTLGNRRATRSSASVNDPRWTPDRVGMEGGGWRRSQDQNYDDEKPTPEPQEDRR